MRWSLLVVVALGSACSLTWNPGTGVGNPGSTTPTLSRVTGVTPSVAEVQVNSLVAERCDGEVQQTEVGGMVNLLSADPIELAGGDLCRIELALTPPLTFRAQADDGTDISLDIPLERVAVSPTGEFLVDGQSFILELGQGDWLTLPLPEDAAQQAAVALSGMSSLYEDDDGDGDLDDDEREDGPVAVGDDDDDDDDDDEPSDGTDSTDGTDDTGSPEDTGTSTETETETEGTDTGDTTDDTTDTGS